MSRRPAAFTQADVARAIRAAKQEGAAEVIIPTGGTRIVIRFDATPPQRAAVDTNLFQHPYEDFEAGYVYFAESRDLIKIGFSRDTTSRLRQMAIGSASELRLVHVEPGTLRTEKEYHRRFATARTHGEWFRKTDELLAYIEQRKAIG